MKIILFITLLMAMSSVFGQGKISTLPKSTSSESKTVKVAPDSNTEDLDLEKYVADYVRKKMADWLERGEFESTAEWTKRIESKKAEKEQEYADEILYRKYGSPYDAPINLTLGRYDVDEEYFPIETNGFGDFRLYLEKDRARYLKDYRPKVNYKYGLVQGKLTILQLSLDGWEALPYEKETGKTKIKKYYREGITWKTGEEEIIDVRAQKENKIYDFSDRIEIPQEAMPKFNGSLPAWLNAKMKGVIPRIELRRASFLSEEWSAISEENRKKKRLLKDTSVLMLEHSYQKLSVLVAFVVEKDGSITNVKMFRCDDKLRNLRGGTIVYSIYGIKKGLLELSDEPNLKKEIERLMKIMPKWEPGRLKDKPIRVECSFLLRWNWSSLY